MSLYSLNKDELIKIICHISADKDKEIAELKQYKMNYDNLILKAQSMGQYAGKCGICKIDLIESFDVCFNCGTCGCAYHDSCVKFCNSCGDCAFCSPICDTCDYCLSCCNC